MRRCPEQFPGDDQLLDLARALVDPEQAHVPVQPFHRDAADVAGAAVNLDGAVGDAADRLAGEVFRGRQRSAPDVLAAVVTDSATSEYPPGTRLSPAAGGFPAEGPAGG